MKRILFYLPRLLTVAMVVFFGLFVFEGFSPKFDWKDSLMHLLLTLPILFIAVLSWKKPEIGSWVFIFVGAVAFFSFDWPMGLIIGGTFILTGALFYLQNRLRHLKN
ncbi:hypothetical protein GYA28_01290 [Candidatus Roizmanbacteria bacterium]|nr:hypothetical protein [Candidatus Roizmanbacteria bacterium]